MPNDVVISVENLSKRYLVGHEGPQERYNSLRDTLMRHGRNFARKTLDMARGRQIVQGDEVEEFWALKDVSFEVKRGEVLGIIGRNGAGKSTLLKILSRITEPTSGRVVLDGRVASLLEVGTGFHPELTGRENIYLNGAILGMSKAEIRRKFDEIVDFSGVEKFLDTPVKRYSSGMYVRLAFAVAAHLEPEILIIDEVLAVGDAEFQKKCLGKMQDVAKGGRTVLFVSHQMGTISRLCTNAILLQRGIVEIAGSVQEVVKRYNGGTKQTQCATFDPHKTRPSITRISIDDSALSSGEFNVEIEFYSPSPITNPVPGVVITSIMGDPVYGSNSRCHPSKVSQRRSDAGWRGCAQLTIANLPLRSGTYFLSAFLGDWEQDYDRKDSALSFDFTARATPQLLPPPEVVGYIDFPGEWMISNAS